MLCMYVDKLMRVFPVLQKRSGCFQGRAQWRQRKGHICVWHFRPRYFLTVQKDVGHFIHFIHLMDFVSFFLCSVWRHHQCHRPNRWWVWSADMYIMQMAGWDTHGAALTVQKTSLFSVALIVCSHVFAAFRCICLWPGAAVYSRGHQAAVLHELLHRGDEDCLETQVRFNEMLYLTLLSTFKINRIQIFTFKPETEQHHLDQHASSVLL